MKKTSLILLRFSLLTIFSIILSNSGYSQLVPDFKADITEGCEPVIINFNDLSTGNPTSWLWDLGNGILSTQKNPVTFYFDPGSYTVSLRVINGSDTQTIIKKNYITVNSLPDVKFKLSDSIGCFPFKIDFTNLSLPKSGEIQKLQWDFGDGSFSNNGTVSHTYNVAGNFTVSLKVTNTAGCSQLLIKPNLVKVLEGVQAGFEVSGASTCSAVDFQFNNTSIGKNIQSYKWDFGDGKSDTATNPSHTYTSQGSYTVGLTVTNTRGCSNSIIKQNVVRIGSVIASFNSRDSVCEKDSIVFTNTSEPAPTSVLWKFGDGSTSTLLNPTKSFNTAGAYTVTLTSFYGGCSGVVTHNITVVPSPSAAFTTSSPLSTCKDPLTVNFKSNDQTLAAYLYNFGDGNTSNSSSPAHTYTTPGFYNVSLQVTNTNGCSSKLTRDSLVYFGPPLVFRISGFPYSGCAPLATKLSAIVNAPEPIVSYLWNFGDSATSTEAEPFHQWSKAGNYSISVKITTVNGCTTTFNLPNGLVLNKKPIVAFTATPQIACAFQQINFKDATSGNVTKLEWFFGDGGTSNEKNPVYNYKDTGSFDVMLVASNDGCFDTLKAPDFIYINPPIARFQTVLDCATPLYRQFKDSSISATSWQWSFGDGTTSTEQNPKHTFSGSGLYNVTLQVSNGTCTNGVINPISVIDENPVLVINNPSKCKGTLTQFLVDSINPGFYNQFLWDFGDGNKSVTQANFTSYSYSAPGNFKPSVTIVDINGCKQSLTEVRGINVFGPLADFSTQPQACIQSEVTINNLSKAYAGFPISTFIWNYGDGTIDTLAGGGTVKHTYDTSGTFTIQLKVTDAIGCTDVNTKAAIILVTQPKASFTISDSLNCLLSDVTFTSTSTGSNLQYLWNFGDGTIADKPLVAHKFNSENQYTIKLLVTDQFGCRDSLTKNNAVKVANVKAALQTGDTLSSCPPFKVTLKNASTNYSSFFWDFDDGSFSNIDTPSHYYYIPGVYKVKLIANGYGSCSDTAITTVTLKGPFGKFTNDTYKNCAPGEVRFIASTTNQALFIWDFGDGTIERSLNSSTTHEYVNPGKYNPKLLLVDVAGCIVPIKGKDTIVISKADAGIKSFNTLFCDSTTVQFYDSSRVDFDKVAGYSWNFGDGSKDTIHQNPVHIYQAPGNFQVTLIIKTANGCSDTSTLQTAIKIVKSPSIKIVGDTGVCQNNPTIFKGEELVKDTSILQWTWDFGNGQMATTQNPPAQLFTTAASYVIKASVTNSSGCTAASQQPLTVYPTPNINAGNDTVLCIGNTLLLQPAGAKTYSWSSQPTLSCLNCATPVARPVIETIYVVEGTSTFGCKSSDAITVGVAYPFKATTSLNDTICLGESFKLFASGSDIYMWSPASGLSSTSLANPVATPTATTTYQVIVSDKYQCFADTGNVKIVVYPIPKINIEQDEYILPVGNSVLLKTTHSDDVTSYKWTPYIALSCIDCPQPIASPRNTTDYYVRVLNEAGCKAEDKVTVTVICNNGNIYIPNTFSPNGDGMNDVFFVRGKGVAGVKAITIFNRWGIVVFQKTNININDPLAGWDGTYNSTILSPDVFVYKVDVVCENSQVFSLKGNVTLIK